jgi:hypothetical protein
MLGSTQSKLGMIAKDLQGRLQPRRQKPKTKVEDLASADAFSIEAIANCRSGPTCWT